MLYECDQCSAALPPGVTECPSCHDKFDSPVPNDAEMPRRGFSAKQSPQLVGDALHETSATQQQQSVATRLSILEPKMIMGLIGAMMLFLGVFAPMVSAPVVGSINYIQNGKGDGIFVLILAVISAYCAITRKFNILYFTGALTLGLLAFTYLNFQATIAIAQDSITTDLANNPFQGIGSALVQSVQIQWGFAAIILGALLTVAAAAIPLQPGDAFAGSTSVANRSARSAPALSAVIFAIMFFGSLAYTQHEKSVAVSASKAKAASDAKQQADAAKMEADQEANAQQAVAEEAQAKQDALNELTLVSYKWQDDDQFSRSLVGTLRNDSTRKIDFVQISFNLFDGDGNTVGTAEDTISELDPGATWKFKADVIGDAAVRARLDEIRGTAEDAPDPAPTADNTILTPTPTPPLSPSAVGNDNSYPGEHYPQTRTSVLTQSDIASWNYANVRYAINEIYARHGFIFDKPEIASQFDQFTWYHPDANKTRQAVELEMSSTEKANFALLAKRRDALVRSGAS